ncbi:MAG TPA: DMT family transporter [Aliidongia sp.]|uniref:DMT family transporter n=1 Tax=Aliidongia sp. TaxID=1914230 RepID=UPI002DDCD8FF|nr:DMT family transporter [Aliidongia sp.]HEV2672969.1 DMT family transporter [Aliidongia sp.]
MPQHLRPSRRLATDLCLLAVAIAWGGSYGATKVALRSDGVLTFLALRFALTSLGLAPFAGRALIARPGIHLRIGAQMGAILFLIFTLETYGVKYTSASNAALLISLCVLFTPLVDGLLTRQRPDPAIFGLAILYMAGAALLTGAGAEGLRSGDLLILAAAVCRALMVTATKRWTLGRQDLSSGALTLVQLATVAALTATVNLSLPTPEPWTIPLDGPFLTSLVFLAGICTGFAFFVQTHMVRATSPTRVAFLMGLEPLFGAAFGILLLGDRPSLGGIAGGMSILAAVLLGLRQEGRRAQPALVVAASEGA